MGRQQRWKEVRAAVFLRDAGRCVWCGVSAEITAHHIRPVVIGGRGEVANLVTLCHRCHTRLNAHSWLIANYVTWLYSRILLLGLWVYRRCYYRASVQLGPLHLHLDREYRAIVTQAEPLTYANLQIVAQLVQSGQVDRAFAELVERVAERGME